MPKYKCIDLDIYKRFVMVFIGNHKDFKRWVEDYYKDDKAYDGLVEYIEDTDNSDNVGTFWYNPNSGDGIIELPKFPRTPTEIATAAHEALHGVFHMLDYCGVQYIPQGKNESFTYLLEYIVKNMLEIENYKIFK